MIFSSILYIRPNATLQENVTECANCTGVCYQTTLGTFLCDCANSSDSDLGDHCQVGTSTCGERLSLHSNLSYTHNSCAKESSPWNEWVCAGEDKSGGKRDAAFFISSNFKVSSFRQFKKLNILDNLSYTISSCTKNVFRMWVTAGKRDKSEVRLHVLLVLTPK